MTEKTLLKISLSDKSVKATMTYKNPYEDAWEMTALIGGLIETILKDERFMTVFLGMLEEELRTRTYEAAEANRTTQN